MNKQVIYSRQNGVTLIEILITVIIMAVGMLGLAAMQNTSVKFAYDSYLRSQGSFLSYDLMDRIRANPREVYQLGVDEEPDQASCKGTTGQSGDVSCNSSQLRDADLYGWYTAAVAMFPDAKFEITHDNGEYAVRIQWESRYENDIIDEDDDSQQFVYQFEVQ